MAWTDYSSTPANTWDASIGSFSYDSSVYVKTGDDTIFNLITVSGSAPFVGSNYLSESYNIPGFNEGYQPEGVNNPISGDLGGGSGGGSTRPTSGFLYPRGQG